MKKSIMGFLVLSSWKMRQQNKMVLPGEDSEPSIAIGPSNGDHDLAHTVVESLRSMINALRMQKRWSMRMTVQCLISLSHQYSVIKTLTQSILCLCCCDAVYVKSYCNLSCRST